MLSPTKERPGGRAENGESREGRGFTPRERRLIRDAMSAPVADDRPHGVVVPPADNLRRMAKATEALLESAILTISVWPDAEARYLAGLRSSMPEMVMTPGERQSEFGIDAAIEALREAREVQSKRSARHRPARVEYDRCLDVLDWLTWLRQQNNGRRDEAIIKAWAHGVPAWRLAQRYGRSDDTIARWRKEAILAITARFYEDVGRLARTLDDWPS